MAGLRADSPAALDHVARVSGWLEAGMAVEVTTRHGGMAMFRHDSGALSHALAAYGEWAENEIALLRAFIPAGGTVLDVGAYIGTHTLAFAKATGPAGHVLAFEAQPDSYSLLVHNIVLNAAAAAEARLAAIGGDPASGVLRVPRIDITAPHSFGSTSLAEAGAPVAGPVADIPLFGLDSLALPRCDLIKIDAEGMEPDILRGAEALLDRARPAVYAECNGVDAGARVVHRLRAAGMQVFAHVVDAFNPGNWRQRGDDIFRGAREVALLGLPPDRLPMLAERIAGPCEQLIPVATLDDLVAAMLLKPQYVRDMARRAPGLLRAATAASPPWP